MRPNRPPERVGIDDQADPRESQGAEIIDLATRNVLPSVTQRRPKSEGLGLAAGVAAVALLGATGLVGYAMRDGINFFRSPSQIVSDPPRPGEVFRIGGLVEKGSLVRGQGETVSFSVTDTNKTIPVRFTGVLLFSGVGGLVPGTLFSLAVRLAPGEQQVAATVGWVQQLSALGQFVGPPVTAALAARAGGWQLTPLFSVGCCVGGAVLAVVIVSRFAWVMGYGAVTQRCSPALTGRTWATPRVAPGLRNPAAADALGDVQVRLDGMLGGKANKL